MLGVAPACEPEELVNAYHRMISQWHPDNLEAADELKAFATRRTGWINEALQVLRQQVQ